jgi:hypothetical protein
MSKFKIYRIDSPDPGIIGHQSKKLVIGYSVLFLLTYFALNSNLLVKELHFPKLIYYIILSILVLTTLALVIIIKRQLKDLKKIGSLEFTQTKINKVIGDLKAEIPYDRINRIEIEKHLRALTVFQSKTGFLTYIIKIVQYDSKEDLFVVSEKSADSGQKFSIINTLNMVKKLGNFDVILLKG